MSSASQTSPSTQGYPPGMDARSTRMAKRLQAPMLIASALTIPSVAISETRGGSLHAIAIGLNWGIWLAFLFELVVMLTVVPDRRAWLRRNPLDLILVVLTPPVLPPGLQGLRVLRLLRLLRLLRFAQISREVFSLEGLRYAALLAVLTAVGGGAVFAAFERHHQHLTFWESTYWALTTMTTLGSDIYPTTTGGEIVAAAVMMIGIAFVALLTGAIAQRFLAPEMVEIEAKIERGEVSPAELALRDLRDLESRVQSLVAAVEKLVEDQPAKPS